MGYAASMSWILFIILFMITLVPVSYTHLDVYKRQFNYFSVQTLGGDPLYHADGTANVNDPVNVAAIEPVSYTHLTRIARILS